MYVIETLLPDGPHWYEGHKRVIKDAYVIEGPQWTPYWDDAYKFKDKSYATQMCSQISDGIEGAHVRHVDGAMKGDGWDYIDDHNYAIRARYLKEGQRVLVSGYATAFTVEKRGKDAFRLRGDSGVYISLGVNSSKKVIITLKPTT